MAQSGGMGDILKIGALGVAGYFLWQWWQGQSAIAAATPPGTVPIVPVSTTTPAPPSTTTPAPPTTTPAPPSTTTPAPPPANGGTSAAQSTLAQQLITAAGGTAATMFNADQWSFYYTQTGHAAIDPNTFTSIFFPNGRPSDSTQNPQMTAAQFVAAIAARGLNGFAGASVIPGGGFMLAPGPGGGFPNVTGNPWWRGLAGPARAINAPLQLATFLAQLLRAAGVGPATAVTPMVWAAAWQAVTGTPVNSVVFARAFPNAQELVAGRQFVSRMAAAAPKGVSGLGSVPVVIPGLMVRR